MTSTYAFDNSWRKAHQLLKSLEAMADPGSIRHLDATGIGAGWRCLEVGAGAGSIARWMGRPVGPRGHVLATDINTRFLQESDDLPLEVREHDIAADPLPEAAFDLIHTRMLLAHLPAREQVIERMLSALRPGGWLAAEELDFSSVHPAPENPPESAERFGKVVMAHHAVMQQRGFDPFYGRCLLDVLRDRGLADVETEGRAAVCQGGSSWAQGWRYTCEQLREEMIGTEIISPGELDLAVEQLDDSSFSFLSQLIVSARGRRPA